MSVNPQQDGFISRRESKTCAGRVCSAQERVKPCRERSNCDGKGSIPAGEGQNVTGRPEILTGK